MNIKLINDNKVYPVKKFNNIIDARKSLEKELKNKGDLSKIFLIDDTHVICLNKELNFSYNTNSINFKYGYIRFELIANKDRHKYDYNFTNKPAIELSTIKIDKQYRGLGYGKMLINIILKFLDNKYGDKIDLFLSALDFDEDPIKTYSLVELYKKFGFVVETDFLNFDYVDDWRQYVTMKYIKEKNQDLHISHG